ncbi:MAG: hypothetical protein WAW86_10590 [Gammaproteobacteria bacterium]
MDIVFFIWEKSERIGLTLSLAGLSLFLNWYARHQESLPANTGDILAGTLAEPSHMISKIMWYMTITSLAIYLGRKIVDNIRGKISF